MRILRSMIIGTACAVLVCSGAFYFKTVYAEEMPAELAHIEALLDDEDAVVDAARKFDRIQQALIEWDLDLADELRKEGDAETADEHLRQARRRIELMDQAYQAILARYPENAKALTYHGELIYDHKGDQLSAVKNWRLATAIDPDLSEPHNNLGLHYCHTGDYVMGLRELDRAFELDSENPDYHYNLAQIYLVHFPQVGKIRDWDRKRIYREAMKHSKRAAELMPNDFDLLQDYAVNFYAAEGHGIDADWDDAAEAWQQARERARNDVEEFYTWLNEARVWIKKPNNKNAEACLLEALALQPDSLIAKQLLDEVTKGKAAS